MSDADGDPGPSRNTRRNGANSPRQAAAAKNSPAMVKKQEERSESRSTSQASTDRDPKEPEFLTKEQKALHVPDYGGKFFTKPSSSKRQSVSNRRFSPDLTPTRQRMTGAQRLGEAAAEFEKELVVEKKIRNLKDTVPKLISMKDKLPVVDFALHPRFGGKAAELYRKFSKGQVDTAESADSEASIPVKKTRSKSATRTSRLLPAIPPPASKSTVTELASFDFRAEGAPSTSQPVAKARSKSAGGMNARVKTGDEDEEAAVEPNPQRGRARTKGVKVQTPQATRAKGVRVKEEVMEYSDNEEVHSAAAVAAQPVRRGRKSVGKGATAPVVPAAPAAVVGGRRKSEAKAVVVKEEPMEEDEQPQPQPRPRRHSMRGAGGGGEAAHAAKAVVKTEPADEEEVEAKAEVAPMTRGRRKSEKGEEAPIADKPSTSAAAADADAAADRSTSRKRGRPVGSTAAAVAERRRSEKMSPPSKKAARRRSTNDQSAAESDEEMDTKEEEEEMKQDEQEEEEGTKKVTRRHRRTKAEIAAARAAELAEAAAKEETVKEEGVTTRRGSFRGGAAAAAPAADTPTTISTRSSPRVPKTPTNKPKPTWAVEADKKREESGAAGELVVDQFAFDDGDDDEKEEEEGSGRTPKGAAARRGKKSSLPDAPTVSSSMMMLDETAAAELSGYGEDSGEESEEPELAAIPRIHSRGGEGQEEAEESEEQAAAASAATPDADGVQPKRCRGRPKKDGTPAVPRPKKYVEPATPMARDRRSTARDPNVMQFLASGGKSWGRAAAGGGIASPTGLSLGGLGSPARVKAPTPPPPVVKAAPGSALSIIRDLRGGNKKKLPSMRSPSPVGSTPSASRAGSRASIAMLAAAAATLGDAPPLSRPPSTASASDKRSATPPPGTSSASAPLKQGELAAAPKDEEEKKEAEKVEESTKDEEGEEEETSQPGSSSQKEDDGPTFDEDTIWITPNAIVKGEKLPPPADEQEKKKEVKEAGRKDQEKQSETKKAKESSEGPYESAGKKEETAQDVLARWTEARRAIDAEHAEAGVPLLPAPAPVRQSARRSIAAPARFGDYELNYGDVRKRSATVGSPAVLPLSPSVGSSSSDRQQQRRRKDDRTPSVAKDETGGGGEAEADKKPSSSSSRKRSRSKKEDKERPRLTLKIRLGTSAGGSATPSSTAADDEREEEAEEAVEEQMDDDVFGDMTSEGTSVASAAAAAPKTATATPTVRKRDRRGRNRNRAFVPKRWKHTPAPHMGFIELENKVIESVTLSCAQTIDAMLLQICEDGIQKSTLAPKEQASEHSRLSARRLAVTRPPPAATPVKPRPVVLPIPPREERTKRVRHAPQSKEYDNLAISVAAGGPEPLASPTSFTALAGFPERKPATERRKESRQDAASKKASTVAIYDLSEYNENESPVVVEKSKKERRREREREERREREEAVRQQRLIPYSELLRKKAHCVERLPGRVLVDPAELFYREIFTDDLGDGIPDAAEPDVVAFAEPVPDDLSAMQPNVAIGVLAEEVAAKLLAVLPRPAPYPDEDNDDEDEEREWSEEDLKRALSHHSAARRDLLDRALVIVNSQRMGNLVVEGQKGAQDVLYNLHVKHALRLKELFPVFSEFRRAESVWLHRSLIRLLPAYLLPVYLEICRFLRYIDSKLAQELSKALQERGEDAEWDAAFKPVKTERTDDDRTEPMLHGSQPASPAASDHDVAAALEAVLESIEKTEKEDATDAAAADAAADAPAASSPDSQAGGLVIDETTEEDKERERAKEKEAMELLSPKQVSIVSYVEEDAVVEEIISKPDLKTVTAILSEVTDRKVREANADTITGSIDPSVMADVIPILVAPIFEVEDAPADFVMKNKPYENMYRLIRYATPTPDKFKPLRPRVPLGECSVAEAMDSAVEQVAAAVRTAVRNKGNGRVILFGWGLSCYINLRVVHLCHGISAVVNFAFSLKTLDGWRGTPDDDICLTYCPSLFVVGAEAPDFDPVEFLMLRQNMIQSPGALVIGAADKNLNISLLRLSRERITQKVANRMILEQVIDFINLRENQLERAKLVPIQLNNVYAVEPPAIKSFTAQEAQQAMVTGGGGKRSATLNLSADGREMTAAQSLDRRRAQMREEKRKRSRLEEQTTMAGRLASTVASSAAPITKRSRTDDGLPMTSSLSSSGYGPARISADYRFPMPGPSPLASPSLSSPGFRMMSRPAILSHNHHHHQYGGQQYHPTQPSPIASTSAAGAAGLLQLQPASSRPANTQPAPSPRGPLDPASISLS